MDYTPEQLEEKFKSLPANVRETLTSVDVEERLRTIGRAHQLHLDILGELADETGLVMLGLTHPRSYVGNLMKRLGISNNEAVSLARDVNEQIFSPIREALKRIHGLTPLAAGGEAEQGEIGGTVPSGRAVNGDIAALEERRERLILGERAGGGPLTIEEDKLRGPVRKPPERIDLNTPSDQYREPVEERDVRVK